MPMYEQIRILHEQKFPKKVPNIFKIPYYRPALESIKKYYRNNRNQQIINQAIISIPQRIHNSIKADHNIRILTAFRGSPQSRRQLTLKPQNYLHANPHRNVTLRLSFDLEATERNDNVLIFYNFRNVPIDKKIAEDTIQIAYWIILQHRIGISISEIEYVDLKLNKIYCVKRPSARIFRKITQYAQIVNNNWSSI
jgi:hypothetical protein